MLERETEATFCLSIIIERLLDKLRQRPDGYCTTADIEKGNDRVTDCL